MRKMRSLTTTETLVIGFLVLILSGTLLLMLPIASKDHTWGNIVDCLFTATSASCVTGLIAYDTAAHWSLFGQIVILIMIQIGGLGFMVLFSMMILFAGKKLTLHDRNLIQESSGNTQKNGIAALTKRIMILTFASEGVGAVLLTIFFKIYTDMSFIKCLYYGIFHSISAFCNAGFDLFGNSLVDFKTNIPIILTIALLIQIGGLGFMVWSDLIKTKLNWRKMQLHTKIVLIMNFAFVVIPMILFMVFERSNAFVGYGFGDKLLLSFFQSVTLRTAGFNSIDQATLTEASKILSVMVMFVGGSSGSTAGGIKTTTFAVVIVATFSSLNKNTDVTIGKRKIENATIRQAFSIFVIYILTTFFGALVLLATNHHQIPAIDTLFETVSAICTVGVTVGITQSLSVISKIIIMILMFMGRIGALGLVLIFRSKSKTISADVHRPEEKILVG